MNIVETLEQAINNKDWELVKQAFAQMGGNTQELIRGQREIAIVVDDAIESESSSLEENTSKSKRVSQTKKLQLGKWKNKFKDNGKLAKQDKLIDQKLWQDKEPTSRPKPAKKIDIQCDRCNKDFKVYPRELTPGIGEKNSGPKYICRKCLGD